MLGFLEPPKPDPVLVQKSKPQCLFKPHSNSNLNPNFFNLIFQNIGKEIGFLNDFVSKFQSQSRPFYNLVEGFFKDFLEEKLHMGKVDTIGSFPNDLFLPWSDLNIQIDCTSFISRVVNSPQFKGIFVNDLSLYRVL